MAVSSFETDSSNPDVPQKNKESSSASSRNSETPNNLNGKKMNTSSRKERRKPEQEIYRPKMGLSSKNLKNEDNDIKSEKEAPLDNVKSTVSISENISPKLERDSRTPDSVKSCGTGKSRRPTMQVYVPKAKVAAQQQEEERKKNLKHETIKGNNNETRQKQSNCSNIKDNLETKNRHSSKESEKDLRNHLLSKSSNFIAPSHTGSWADLMEESDLSTNPRSTPEDDLWKNHSDGPDTVISKNRGQRNENSSEHSRKQRNRRSDHKKEVRENSQARSKESFQKTNKSDNDLINGMKSEKQSEQKSNKNISSTSSLSSNNNSSDKSMRNLDTNILTANSSHCNKSENNHFIENKSKLDRKKYEKEQVLPPRFQKNKAQETETTKHNSTRHSGGIIKLPTQYDIHETQPEIFEHNFNPPKLLPEAPKFIHKQLFDPNNPNKPEIVNIPAPVPPSHMPYERLGSSYYVPDSLGYVPDPVQNMGYIPPPQPAANAQFRFLHSNFPSVNNPSHSYVENEAIPPPVHCPVPTTPFSRPHGCYNEETGKKKLKPIVERNLREIIFLEKELTGLLSKGFTEPNLSAIKSCRYKLSLRYENIILADPKYCAENNPEHGLWKTVYHQIIESLRKKLDEKTENTNSIKEILMNFIIEGTMFYENLLEKQQETHGFKLNKILELKNISTACLPDQLRCVLISVQKSLIYLGDLARYKEQVSQTTNYGTARSLYLKAQQIAPKNGRPYHQLAILANSTRRKLDAVYYYMRSLAASNPILSAKESLLSLFEEARKKYEQYEKNRKKEKVEEANDPEDDSSDRYEIWIKRDGSSSQHPADTSFDSADLTDLSDIDLNKRFITSFLHVHGKLFTKVGMETFPDVFKTMLKEFNCLLQRSPLPITSTRILQLLAINIFSVSHSSQKENGREHGGCSLLQEQALYTSMVMMSLLMDRCVFLHISHKSSTEAKIICDDMAQLLPAVNIWTDWMSCQKCLWSPPSSVLLERLNMRPNKDVWISFANLLTILQEIDLSEPAIYDKKASELESLVLEEDITFAGFVPLLEALHDPAYADPPFDKEKAKNVLRMKRIQFFGDYLCGTIPYCMMKFDVESKKFVPLVKEMSLKESYDRSALFCSSDESRKEETFDKYIMEDDFTKPEMKDELRDLWYRREALSKFKEQQEQHKAQAQAVLQNNQTRPILLEVKPRYLVPDTNCFIDHLCHFRNILSSTNYHVVIPLVVVNELYGLARGNRASEHSSPEHISRVTVLSQEAINFLEEQFASRHPHLRAITSKGSILDTISFRSEEKGKNKGTNDDLILECCLRYCEDRAERYMPKNPNDCITLFREVVLLTDDRNLRIKARAHYVPVKDLLSFLQWANS
ncbi:telomerase-binding protein EST1A-like isoform X2 [Argiope bruennichi]|uniref:telomerase-binding protein EST1A-like isoform X2 n=1 Tax=Argiope bruennichi TaxID=94029 RepID=UPI0024945DD7|nr:telomerase-binding protein EST1A-like isoform X2 [Argiope bruennichi]